ncbi:hypothetical protein AB0L65_44420 [Nonomuraea sp. NPDC052116]|uniref:DUF6980 family protein n=1 Tax=Nonomuraea sp. NPDC052116 TaxID=3155665 RepID=UPI00343C167D
MVEHSCESMVRQVTWECDQHADPFDCPDALITFNERFIEYGLIIHDGGTSVIVISYCPWCGMRLTESRRDRWFDALEALGVDPSTDEIPTEYQDGRWLQS